MMNDSFKLIIIIGNNTQSREVKTNESQNSFLQENIQYHIFTSYTPSNIIVATKISVTGKYINESLFSKDDIYQFFLSNDSICFEFDEVFSEIHHIDLIFNMNFRIEELTNKLNSCIMFSSQHDSEKIFVFENYISKFMIDYFKLISNVNVSTGNSLSISGYLLNQQKQFDLFDDKITSLEQANQMLKEMREKQNQYFQDNNINSDGIIIIFSIQVKCSEITFIKLNIKEPQANNTLNYLSSDITAFVNLDKYEKVYLISCVSPTKENLKKSIQELYFMNDIYKEITTSKANNSLQIPLLNSLRSMTSIDDINSNITMSNKRYFSNAFVSQNNNIENVNANENTNTNNHQAIKHENNLSIIPPDCTISMSDTNYHIKNNKSDVETLYSYLKTLSLHINDKNKYETKIKLLEEQLNKERKIKGEIEIDYKVSLEKLNELNKALIIKDVIINTLEEKNKKNKSEKKEYKELNKKNELKIFELIKENEKLKATNDNYTQKYKAIQDDNVSLNKRITTIQHTLSLIIKNKDADDSK